MRSISRTVDVSFNTVKKLLIEAGRACAIYHDETVRDVSVRRVQCDEIWSFCYAKAKNVEEAKAAPEGAGDVWTWTALDSDSKMILAYEVGDRSLETAIEFMRDLEGRLANRVQLTTDGHRPYLEAVEEAFGGDIDYAQLGKVYKKKGGEVTEDEDQVVDVEVKKKVIQGSPDPRAISTSHVERHNLTMRMGMRRFTRLTNAFSKKLENHCHMLNLFFVHYNFARIHKTLRVSPAMEAGLVDTLYDMEWIAGMVEEQAPKPKRPKRYKRRPRPLLAGA